MLGAMTLITFRASADLTRACNAHIDTHGTWCDSHGKGSKRGGLAYHITTHTIAPSMHLVVFRIFVRRALRARKYTTNPCRSSAEYDTSTTMPGPTRRGQGMDWVPVPGELPVDSSSISKKRPMCSGCLIWAVGGCGKHIEATPAVQQATACCSATSTSTAASC